MRKSIFYFLINSVNFRLLILTTLLFALQVSGQTVPLPKRDLPFAAQPPDDFTPPAPVSKKIQSAAKPLATGEVDTAFDSLVSDDSARLEAVLPLPDGKIMVGGFFTKFNGAERRGIVRLNADGTLDPTFNATTDFGLGVFTIVRQTDGKFIIGGSFTTVNGMTVNRIARLNADGTLDASFNTGSGFSGGGGTVYDIKIQADGKILVGGEFTSFNGVSRSRVARLTADGALDPSFNPGTGPNAGVYRFGIQADGKILLAGFFFNVGGVTRTGFARLNADGTLDTSFTANLEIPRAYDIVPLPNGKIMVGGAFEKINLTPRSNIARLHADGSVDQSFTGGVIGYSAPQPYVEKIEVQPDGKIVAGGLFIFDNILRFNEDGSFDNSFSAPAANASVEALALQPDGKILAGGFFTAFGSTPRNRLAQLDESGALDDSFNAGEGFTYVTNGIVYATLVQPDGKILIGGQFQRVGGAPRFGIARLNADGSLDDTFNSGAGTQIVPGQTNYVLAMALQPDGKIIIGGAFEAYDQNFRGNIARLNADGTLDSSFLALTQPLVRKILVQPDGKILVGGQFFEFNRHLGGDGFQQYSLVRLAPNGWLDSTFNNGKIQFGVFDMGRQSNGKIIVGGSFTSINSVARNRIARLNADGTLDAGFNPGTGPDSTVFSVAILPGDKIFIGGSFANVNGTSRGRVARLNADGSLDNSFDPGTGANSTVYKTFPQPDGKVLIGGNFTTFAGGQQKYLARLNSNGSLDAAYPLQTNGQVWSITQYDQNRIMIGGAFSLVGTTERSSVARLHNETAASRTTKFDFDGDGKSDISVFRAAEGAWYLNRSSAGFAAVQFGSAGDRLAPADYDGDGKTDIAVFRDGAWYLQRSQAGFLAVQFGQAGDVPQPADFDGDGRAEIAVFRPSNGTWYTQNLLNNQFTAVQFGISDDFPAAADYDGDGKADYAVYRAGIWYLLRSQLGFAAVQFGISGDKPVTADFDGDGKSDHAVFRPADGTWYLLCSTEGFTATRFGIASDLPAPADFDGDGKTDLAVFREGNWYILQSVNGYNAVRFGTAADQPVPNAFLP